MEEFKMVLAELSPLIRDLLVPVVLALVSAALWKWRQKTGMETTANQRRELAKLARDAVCYAEEQARKWAKLGTPRDGHSKLDKAVKWATAEAKRRNLGEVAGDHMAGLIESWLGGTRPPKFEDPDDSVVTGHE